MLSLPADGSPRFDVPGVLRSPWSGVVLTTGAADVTEGPDGEAAWARTAPHSRAATSGKSLPGGPVTGPPALD
ncbi:hypothetical protein JOF29_006738 [Kribbella aluminosa]|uniref:Uncharacterized protein n=1 Tax=Kribbella aluminosa TaxID=416017 RepID=A0ABS4UVG3_9ACTN|nr:hypothetical protein [Kribbella aluminosa]MBP2355628.1 hypothetical protein [Kribbella aluminosa]